MGRSAKARVVSVGLSHVADHGISQAAFHEFAVSQFHLGLTQEALAKKAGISAYLARYTYALDAVGKHCDDVRP